MERSSYKNILQEYCQKNKFELPKYVTKKVGGTDDKPEWQSTLTLYNGKQYKGTICSKSKLAEFSVAKIVIDNVLNKSTTESIDIKNEISCEITDQTNNQLDDVVLFEITKPNNLNNLNNNPRNVLLLDLENLPRLLDNITEKELSDDNLRIYVFVGEHHDLVDKVFPYKVIKIISPSTRINGTDTCIQVHVGMFLSLDLFDNYYIASKDKFGSNLVDIITSNNFGWKGKKARVITKLFQIYL